MRPKPLLEPGFCAAMPHLIRPEVLKAIMSFFPTPASAWSERVNRVFDTEPRNGGDPNAVWLPRTEIENQFSNLLAQDGVHICVDGPSGTGKSSLVLTQLRKTSRRVITIQL